MAYNIEGFDEYVADKIAMEITEKYKPVLLGEPVIGGTFTPDMVLTRDEYNDRKHKVDFEGNEIIPDRMISVDRVMEIIDKAFDDAVPVREKHSQG